MRFLIPPKTPLNLAVYTLALFAVLSVIWTFLHLPPQIANIAGILLFGGVGYAYGRAYGVVLPFKKALMTCLYFAIPILTVRMLPTFMEGIRSAPREDVAVVILITMGVVALIGGLQLLFHAIALFWATKLSARPLTTTTA
jgi:hypothetical protein